MGAATITGVPAAGLPNSTSVVSRNCRPTWLASALWSITAKTFRPFAARMPVRCETVSVTDLGLTLVVICVSIQSAMAIFLSLARRIAAVGSESRASSRARHLSCDHSYCNGRVRHDAGVATFASGLRTPFARYWLSGFLADFGDGVRLAAFPLLAAELTRSPAAVAAVTAVQGLPWLLLGSGLGVVVDRTDRRRLMVTVDLARAA